MTGERGIDGDELHVFHSALGKQKPVEGIAGWRLGLDMGKGVAFVDQQKGYTSAVCGVG